MSGIVSTQFPCLCSSFANLVPLEKYIFDLFGNGENLKTFHYELLLQSMVFHLLVNFKPAES